MNFFRISRKRAVPYVAATPTVSALGLSSTSFTLGTASSGTITGGTIGSTLSVSGAPTGFTINSAARTWAYDGTGSATSGSLILSETGNPAVSTIAYVVSPPSAISAPVLARTSATGAAPILWTTQLDRANTFPGYILHLQVAASLTPSKNSDGSYVTPTQDIYHLLTPSEDEILDLDFTSDGFITPSGAYSLQIRVERDDSTFSPWSNALSDTISSAVAVYAAATTAPSPASANVTLSNGNRTQTGFAGGGVWQGGRTNQAAGPNKFQVEWTINSLVNSLSFGCDNGSTDFRTGFPRPGESNSNGFFFEIYSGGSSWGRSSFSVTGSGSTSAANGDVITMICDKTAGTANFKRTRSGTTIDVTTITGLSFANWYFYSQSKSNDQVTVNTGNATFAVALTTGIQNYG